MIDDCMSFDESRYFLMPNVNNCFQVDFLQMPVNTLRRYKRHYKLQTRQGLNKSQLADVSLSLELSQYLERQII